MLAAAGSMEVGAPFCHSMTYPLAPRHNGSAAEVDEMVAAFQVLGENFGLLIGVLYIVGSTFCVLVPAAVASASASACPSSSTCNGDAADADARREVAPWAAWGGMQELRLIIVDVLRGLCAIGVRRLLVSAAQSLTRVLLGSHRPRSNRAGGGDGTTDTPELAAAARGEHGVSHMAIIMDGNRRYGKKLLATAASAQQCDEPNRKEDVSVDSASPLPATSPLNGHKAGGDKLMELIRWSIDLRVKMLTVYAFSTENWNRSKEEIDTLMRLFEIFFGKIRASAQESGIFIRFVATDAERLPAHILKLMLDVEHETAAIRPRRITVNVCVSYGSRGEIVNACRCFAREVAQSGVDASEGITEDSLGLQLMRSVTESASDVALAFSPFAYSTSHAPSPPSPPPPPLTLNTNFLDAAERALLAEPQVLLRTSGEYRLSNFMLYQCAYSELIFVPHTWPETSREDFIRVLAEFASRRRRFGK